MSDKLKDYIDLFHERSVFIPTKTIKLTGDVDEDMYNLAVSNLHALDSTPGSITIKLMSDGGSVSIARAIYDLILGCKNEVRIQCYGEVSSSASIILQASDLRIMSPNSKIMIHVGSESVPQDHPRNVDRLYEQHRLDEKWIEDVYLNKIKEKKKRFTRNQLKDIMIFDKYLSPKDSLELGLIDQIGELQ
jgi:ATP-dependent protease ClpP protease subunit